MSQEVLLMLALFVTSLMLFLSVYFMITLSDLESDYINSIKCSESLNFWTVPRIILMISHTIISFPISTWIMLLSLPSSIWLLYTRHKIRPGNSGLYEPTEIHNREKLRRAIMESLGTTIVLSTIS